MPLSPLGFLAGIGTGYPRRASGRGKSKWLIRVGSATSILWKFCRLAEFIADPSFVLYHPVQRQWGKRYTTTGSGTPGSWIQGSGDVDQS
eukprot:545655-Rhodomonas_salina.1